MKKKVMYVMRIKPFELERYFAKYEFSAPYLMSSSDCEALRIEDLLAVADAELYGMWQQLKLSYTEAKGHPLLREEITRLYETIRIEDTLVLTPEEGIYIGMQCLIEQGDHMIVTYPGYQSLYEIASTLGAEISKWEPDMSNGISFKIEDLGSLIREDTKCIVINFPHNPTGASLSREQLEEVVALAKEHDLYIFSDEMYRYLEYRDEDRLPSVSDIYDKGLSLSGMSKTFALPGLRIGWLTTKDKDLMQSLCTYKDYTTICNSAPSEVLAMIGLREKESIIATNLQMIYDNMSLLKGLEERYKTLIKVTPPMAGPICLVELLVDVSVDEFAKELVETEGVMVLPLSTYQFEGDYFRVGLGRKNFPKVLAVFERFLAKYE